MSLGNTMRRGVFWLFIGNTGNQVLSFAFGIVLARLLAPEDFGMLVTLQVFTGLAGFIAGGGMGQALVRAKTASKEDYDIVFTLQLFIGCLIYGVFFAIAPWFAAWYETPLYADLLRVSALTFLLRPFVNLPSSILHREMRFKAQALVRIASLIIASAVSIGMAYAGYGVWSLVLGGICGSVGSLVILLTTTAWRPGLSTQLRRGRDIARYGFLVSANDIVGYLRQQSTNFILSRTAGAAAVGLFNKAHSLALIPHGTVTVSVYQVLFRALAQEQDNKDASRYLFLRSISLVTIYVTPLYVFAFWLAEPLISVVYGAKWLPAAAPLAILALAGPFRTISNMSGAVLSARNWIDKELIAQIIMTALIILTTLIAQPYGLNAIAAGLVGVSIINSIYMFALARACIDSRWRHLASALAPGFTLNAVLVMTLFILDKLSNLIGIDKDIYRLFVAAPTGAILYFLLALYLPFTSLKTEQERWKTAFINAARKSTRLIK